MIRLRTYLFWALAAQAVPELMAQNPAQQYAAELKKLTESYLKQLSAKASAEEKAYAEAAALYAKAAEDTAYLGLTAERLGLAMSRAADLTDGSLSVNHLIHQEIPAYAVRDFSRTKDLFASGLTAEAAYLENLETLDVEKKKTKALAEVLESLARKGSVIGFLKEALAFREAVGKQLPYTNCALLLSRKNPDQVQLTATGVYDADSKTCKVPTP